MRVELDNFSNWRRRASDALAFIRAERKKVAVRNLARLQEYNAMSWWRRWWHGHPCSGYFMGLYYHPPFSREDTVRALLHAVSAPDVISVFANESDIEALEIVEREMAQAVRS